MPTVTDNSPPSAGATAAGSIAADDFSPSANNPTPPAPFNNPTPPALAPVNNNAVAAEAASDKDSISTEALLESIETDDEDDAEGPGKVEEFVNDDSAIPPNERTTYMLFLAKSIGIDVESNLSDILSVPGKKSLVKITKAMLYREIKRRDPSLKVNKKNTSVQGLWNVLPTLTDTRDVNYIRAQEAVIRERLLAAARATEAESSVARRQGTDVMRVFLLILKYPELRRAYMLSQDPSNREMLDEGETYKSKFLKLLVRYFNDPTKIVSTPRQASLHSSFSEPILCSKGEFELTEEKAKKLLNDSRRHLTTMINKYMMSGNGANQRADDEDEEQEIDMDLWGRFDGELALERALEKGDDTNDGDDRANFLNHLPPFWLMVWHICDEGDLLRFTCAQLRDEHSASSTTTPNSVSRGSGQSSARKLAQQTYELQKQIAESVKNIGKAVANFSANQDKTFERATKIRRLDTLKGDRYLTFKDSKNPLSVDEERAAAAEYVKELDKVIAQLERELAEPVQPAAQGDNA